MTLDLYLFRHGESGHNAKDLGAEATIGGRSPHLVLSERGIKQAEALGAELKRRGVSLDCLYASPTVRSEQTARIIADTIGFPADRILTSEALHEVSNGSWEGRSKKEVYTPETTAQINANNWQFCPPSGESQQQAANRMYDFTFQNLIEGKDISSDVRAGFVTHGTVIKDFRALITVREIMGLDETLVRNAIRSCVENCSIAQFKYVPGGQKFAGWHEVSWNDHAHLYMPGFSQEGYFPGRKLVQL